MYIMPDGSLVAVQLGRPLRPRDTPICTQGDLVFFVDSSGGRPVTCDRRRACPECGDVRLTSLGSGKIVLRGVVEPKKTTHGWRDGVITIGVPCPVCHKEVPVSFNLVSIGRALRPVQKETPPRTIGRSLLPYRKGGKVPYSPYAAIQVALNCPASML